MRLKSFGLFSLGVNLVFWTLNCNTTSCTVKVLVAYDRGVNGLFSTTLDLKINGLSKKIYSQTLLPVVACFQLKRNTAIILVGESSICNVTFSYVSCCRFVVYSPSTRTSHSVAMVMIDPLKILPHVLQVPLLITNTLQSSLFTRARDD